MPGPSTFPQSTWTWDAPAPVQPPVTSAFQRLWLGFMMARIALAVVLLVLLGGMMTTALAPMNPWQLALVATYLVASLIVRLFTRPAPPGRSFDPQWVSTIGIDLVAISTLQFLQVANLSYSPLFALPVLTASVLGSALLAMGTAAGVTLLLLGDAWVQSLELADHASRLAQAGLAGAGYFVVALLANQLAVRLEREEHAARRSRSAARTQARVNEVVIEKIDFGHTVRLATRVDGEEALTYSADGLIIATPTGSTAYNLSAGGPILAPTLRAMVMTPVAPHFALDRSLVLTDAQEVCVAVAPDRAGVLVIDGTELGRLEPGATITCRVASRPVRVVRNEPQTFGGILRFRLLADRS